MISTTPTERIEDIVSAIRVFKKTAEIARESSKAIGHIFPELKIRWDKQARRRDRAAERLIKLLGRECIKLSQPKVWGGQLLGWTTQAEVDALDKSIKTDW